MIPGVMEEGYPAPGGERSVSMPSQRQTFDIPAHVGQGVSEILLGRQWLKTRQLMVDMPSGVLTLR